MSKENIIQNSQEMALNLNRELNSVKLKNTPNLRAVRKKYSLLLQNKSPAIILDIAREFLKISNYRWVAFEIIRYHKGALKLIGEDEVIEFAKELNSWGSVDAFAGLLAGPAWQLGNVPDKRIIEWAQSYDRWLRRTSLVCTVALNKKSAGGTGNVPKTIKICRLLKTDKDDMVVKAMSWALRELIPHDVNSVIEFLTKYDSVLHPRIKREVKNKIETGLKTPRTSKSQLQ